jgi:predicted nucleic acid-binding protein
LQKPLTLKSANEFIDALLDAGNLTILGETREHHRVLKELSLRHPRVAANLIHDFHTAVLLYEYEIPTFYSADTDFMQFDFLEVYDPVH